MKYLSNLNLEIFGSSHSDKIGMKLSGIKKGERIDTAKLKEFVDRRKPSGSIFSTKRAEPDIIEIESGIENGIVTGDVTAVIRNVDIKSKDYDALQFCPRPSHADYPAKLKYGLDYDVKGGGSFSGRMTAPLCIAGGIAKQILEKRGIRAAGYVSNIGGIRSLSYEDRIPAVDEIEKIQNQVVPTFSKQDDILRLLEACRNNSDSVGGQIECVVTGLQGGIGGCLFDGIESELAGLLYAVPAVKAVEFGSGVELASMRGSEANDGYRYVDGKVVTESNHNGGILGGITVGSQLLIRVTVKPTPSIAARQHSVDLSKKENVDLVIKGRHDVCIVPRAVAAVEAAICIGILDIIGE